VRPNTGRARVRFELRPWRHWNPCGTGVEGPIILRTKSSISRSRSTTRRGSGSGPGRPKGSPGRAVSTQSRGSGEDRAPGQVHRLTRFRDQASGWSNFHQVRERALDVPFVSAEKRARRTDSGRTCWISRAPRRRSISPSRSKSVAMITSSAFRRQVASRRQRSSRRHDLLRFRPHEFFKSTRPSLQGLRIIRLMMCPRRPTTRTRSSPWLNSNTEVFHVRPLAFRH